MNEVIMMNEVFSQEVVLRSLISALVCLIGLLALYFAPNMLGGNEREQTGECDEAGYKR